MPIVLGHRGGRGEGWPAENSLAAFERALREGADGVELDVRLTADGVAVLAHDARLADGRLVHRATRAELADLATLDEALDLLAGHVVNVELKADVPSRRALARAAARAVARARPSEIVVSSFDPRLVLASAALVPRTPRGILVGRKAAPLATPLPLAMRALVVAAHLEDPLVDARRVERLSRAGLRTCAWTVNDPARAARLVAAGVPWLITDRPAEILAAIRGHT